MIRYSLVLHTWIIIFSKPKDGEKHTPELIADGDLDGDIYFIKWDIILIQNANWGEQFSIPNDEMMGIELAEYVVFQISFITFLITINISIQLSHCIFF